MLIDRFRTLRVVVLLLALGTGRVAAQDQPLVFVHGLGGAGSNWSFVAPAIQNQFQVFALTPSLGGGAVYSSQAGALHTTLAGYLGVAGVSHSNGAS